jgi:EAL domain-containing protein (putative c-di-GMP-specific phosphodiesterase class I)
MIDLVHALGFEALAEGVETAGQLEQLRAMGCGHGPVTLLPQAHPSETAPLLLESVLCTNP